jgi:hypothetical protein
MAIELRVKNLESGDPGTVSFDSEDAAAKWLTARPRFVDVLGPASHMAEDVATRLRALIRPLDADEKALELKGEEARRAAIKALADDEKRRAEMQTVVDKREIADPDRPMRVRWTYDGGLEVVDKDDTRPITDEARAAVLAWVAERDEWVKERGQMVGDARCTLKKGKITEGQFIPVTAVAKPAN